MARIAPNSAEARRIDDALATWRQGDVALDQQWFVHVGDSSAPLTGAAAESVSSGVQALKSDVYGLVLVTQTCDVVRSCVERPFIEVCPLVEVDEPALKSIQRAQRPNYAFVPALAAKRLVADLDRVMTLEKSIVAGWERLPGLTSDLESRTFGVALARKRSRAAFPDDFTTWAQKLRARMTEKHGKESPEGKALRALQEIRVQAAPSWDEPAVELLIWFICEDAAAAPGGKTWDQWLRSWSGLIASNGRFTIYGQIATLADLTAEDYVNSDPLDLNYLSSNG